MRPLAAALALLACLALIPARGAPKRVHAAWTKAALVDAAAVHASKADSKQAKYLRYVDLSAIAPDDRPKALQALGYVVNSWSRNDQIVLPQVVEGTEYALAAVDLSTLRARHDEKGLEQLLEAFERLGEKGSGPAPFPEPYFHHVEDREEEVEEESFRDETYSVRVQYRDHYGQTYWVHEERTRRVKVSKSRTVKKRVVALSPALHRATALGLATVTGTNFPIFEYRWLLANGLCEPRYHELLGLDDTEASARKLAAVHDKDEVVDEVRGAVLWSEVALHNRILERKPTRLRKGRGTFQFSLDFKTSVRLQDVLKDLLIARADAKEIIWTLPNGLQGFLVVDGEGKRLDKADGDVAINSRSRFKDRQVRTAFHCIACHLPDRGWIEVDDEVRALAKKPVTLYVQSVAKSDKHRGDRIRQTYLDDDFNTLLTSDQAVVEVAVAAATKGADGKALSCPQTAKLVSDAIYAYAYEPVTLQQAANELGYSQDEVLAACGVKGLDPAFAVFRSGRRLRRDSFESGFSQLAVVLFLGKHLKKEAEE